MKVWIVTTGEYSSKYTLGIFSSEKLANDYSDYVYGLWDNFYGCARPTCWECEIDEPVGPMQQGMKPFTGHIHLSTGEFREDPKVMDYAPGVEYAECGDVVPQCLRHGENWLAIYAWAKDADHAAKIMTDKRRQWLVENEGR